MSAPLYIRIAESDFCFARFDALQLESFRFEVHHVRPQSSFTMNLRDAKDSCSMLREPASRVEVLVTTPVTPVPLAEFQEEDCERIYRLVFPTEGKIRVFYDTVPAANTVLLFALGEHVCRTLEDNFGDIRYTSAQSALLQCFSTKALGVEHGPRVFTYVHDGRVDIAMFDGNRLLMQNAYDIRAVNDVIYYVFSIASHRAIDLSRTPFYVVGDAMLVPTVVGEMQKYAAKVFTINPTADFNRHVVSTTAMPYDMMLHLLQ